MSTQKRVVSKFHMTCENNCFDCPLASSLRAENSRLELQRQAMVGSFELAMAQNEDFGAKLDLVGRAQEAGIPLEPAAALPTEDMHELAASALRNAGSFLDQYCERADATLEANRAKIEAAPTDCRGPKERRRYILFGQKILRCGSGAISAQDRRGHTRSI